MVKKRDLTPEEERLWRETMSGAKKISSKRVVTPPVAKKPTVKASDPRVEMPQVKASLEPLERGRYAGVDRNTADKFRRGDTPLDGTLDLHGMNRERAREALVSFVQSHYTRGSRCLLIVTGKGVRKDEAEMSERGILRDMLPSWLGEDRVRPLVLAYDTAKPKHGGSGAYYVLLKRKR